MSAAVALCPRVGLVDATTSTCPECGDPEGHPAQSVVPCPPNCACSSCEEAEIVATRALAIEAEDWYRLAATVGVHPKDMSLFVMSEISLTAPMRERIRKALT